MSGTSGDRTILLVDDDADIRETLAELLEFEGYAVVGAADGAEALARLRDGVAPCLILLDLMMPVMDGYQFLAVQRQDPAFASIPVIVVTAGATLDRTAIDASAIFTKPLDLAELIQVIGERCR